MAIFDAVLKTIPQTSTPNAVAGPPNPTTGMIGGLAPTPQAAPKSNPIGAFFGGIGNAIGGAVHGAVQGIHDLPANLGLLATHPSQFIQGAAANPVVSNIGKGIGATASNLAQPTINYGQDLLKNPPKNPLDLVNRGIGGLQNTIGETAFNLLNAPSTLTQQSLEHTPLQKVGVHTPLGFLNVPGVAAFGAGLLTPTGEAKTAEEGINLLKGFTPGAEDVAKNVANTAVTQASKLEKLADNFSKEKDPYLQAVGKNLDDIAVQKVLGQGARSDFVGIKNERIGESNQLANLIQKFLPNSKDREALSLYQEIKNNPNVQQKIIADLGRSDSKIEPFREVFEKAVNPTSEMITASQHLDNYFSTRIAEGQAGGYVKGNIENYMTHIMSNGEETGNLADISRSSVSRSTQFGQGRVFPTVYDAIKNDFKPATLDASNIVKIYGNRDAVANATSSVMSKLQEEGIGAWKTPDNLPQGWKQLHDSATFRKGNAYLDAEGKPQINNSVFAVPEEVANELKPIVQPDYLKSVGGFSKWRLAQQFSKYVNLSLSLFHAKALALTMEASNPTLFAKVIRADLNSPEFTTAEKDLLRHGGTSPILGGVYDAYGSLKSEGKNLITNNPITRAYDKVSSVTSGITFDQLQRRAKVLDYSTKVAGWMSSHPDATDAEINAAKNKFGTYVNGIYGGLNFENMGLTKSQLTLMRTLLLAPDWTFSNLLLPFQAAKGTVPVGATAKFYATSLATGIALTQMTNLFLNGKVGNDPFNVDLGKNKSGSDVKANMYFAGSINDLVKLFNDTASQGAIGGVSKFASGKLAPGVRQGVELATNQDYFGNPITSPGQGFIPGTLDAAKYAATNVVPLPFLASNPLRLATSKGGANPTELGLAATGLGSISTHSDKTDAYNKAYNAARAAGKSDLSSRLAGVAATKPQATKGFKSSKSRFNSVKRGFK